MICLVLLPQTIILILYLGITNHDTENEIIEKEKINYYKYQQGVLSWFCDVRKPCRK